MRDFFTTPAVSKDSFVRELFALNLVGEKGKWNYSNAGYSLLTLIVEKASGMPYRTFMKEEVFKPLGLTSTGFLSEKYMPEAFFAHSYNRDLEFPPAYEWPVLNEELGAADIVSNISDLLTWARLNADSNFIDKSVFTMQHTAQVQITPATSYGYGWFTGTVKHFAVRL